MPPITPESWHVQVEAAPLSISGGLLHIAPDQIITEENDPGLKLVLLLSEGAVRYHLPRSGPTQVRGPAMHLSLSRRPFTVVHSFHADAPLRYVAIRLPQSTLHQWLDQDIDSLSRRLHGAASSPFTLNTQADKPLQALAQQLLLCPLQGDLRQLYLSGKALELTATVLAALDTKSPPPATNMPARQRDCLQQARALLLENLAQPPSLEWLAAKVGLSITLLTRGFRQLFGTSVYEFVREQRLEFAYHLLASGDCSVSIAASACGYSDSHFSKVFQKRFGVAPHALRR